MRQKTTTKRLFVYIGNKLEKIKKIKNRRNRCNGVTGALEATYFLALSGYSRVTLVTGVYLSAEPVIYEIFCFFIFFISALYIKGSFLVRSSP